jgi:hypothetical protein
MELRPLGNQEREEVMERLLHRDLDELVDLQSGPCVSVYLPLYPVGRDSQQDATRLRRLLHEAERQLIERGLSRTAAAELLAPARALPHDEEAWQSRGQWIAIFLSTSLQRILHGHGAMEEALFVDNQFHVRPLLPLLAENDRFFLLALSQNSVRLFDGNSRRLALMEVPGLPQSLDEALDNDGAAGGFQPRTATRGGKTAKQSAGIHGQDSDGVASKSDLTIFLRQIAGVVDRRLASERAPLVLATVAENVSYWRSLSHYPHLLDNFVPGNPDYLPHDQLHAKAWPLVQPALDRDRELAHQRLVHAHGKVMFGLKHVIPAATSGRVDTLFIDCSRPQWGQYDADHQAVELHDEPQPGDADLVELAATATLRHRGQVYALTAENGKTWSAAEALLRY